MRVAVVGGRRTTEATYDRARRLGRALAECDHGVVCGGYGGVMEAVSRGANEGGGHAVGILKGTDPAAGNDYLDTAIATGLGNARNVLVVLNGAAVVALDGGAGTLSEVAHALDLGRPVVGLGALDLPTFEGFRSVETVAEAVASVERRAGDGSGVGAR